MPFQEITRAVPALPTWPMPQAIAEAPSTLWAMPSTRRLSTRTSRLKSGRASQRVASSISRPPRAQPVRP